MKFNFLILSIVLNLFLFGFLSLILILNPNLLDNSSSNLPNPPIKDQACGFEQCHGLDLTCGTDIPEMCTAIFMVEDVCRKYASCRQVDNFCQLQKLPEFDSCRECIRNCELLSASNSGEDVFTCASKCAEE